MEESVGSLLKFSKLSVFSSDDSDKSKSILLLLLVSSSLMLFEIKGVLSNPSNSKSILLVIPWSDPTSLSFSSCFSKLILELPGSKSSESFKAGISILKSPLISSLDVFKSVLEIFSASSSKVESGIIR